VPAGGGSGDRQEGAGERGARRGLQAALVVVILLGAAAPAGATLEASRTLAGAIQAAATWAGIAPELLAAVVWVESRGHPWAVRTNGAPSSPRTRAEALALVQASRGRADIGLAQIHYPLWGPVLGLRPEDLLDPWVNLHVAARILRLAMLQEPGSWGGVGRYHSATPQRKWAYATRVAAVVRALRPSPPPAGVGLTP
jgi:hypothetical protein